MDFFDIDIEDEINTLLNSNQVLDLTNNNTENNVSSNKINSISNISNETSSSFNQNQNPNQNPKAIYSSSINQDENQLIQNFQLEYSQILNNFSKQINNQPYINENKESKGNFRSFSYSKKDQYYRKAKEEGYRARSVYKLNEIDMNFNLLSKAELILDLCAAPGSWSQMLRSNARKSAKICSVDLQVITPIEGVHTIQGDITKQSTLISILSYFNNEKIDLIVFDGAPDVTGILEIDINMQVKLITCSLIMCLKLLKQEGRFVAKVFKTNDHNEEDYYYDKAKSLFKNVSYYKPSSSRSTSNEVFLVGDGFCIDEKLKEEIGNISLEEIFLIGSVGIESLYEEDGKEGVQIEGRIYSKEVVELVGSLFDVMN